MSSECQIHSTSQAAKFGSWAMTTFDGDLPVTRRLVLRGAGSVAIAGLGIAELGIAFIHAPAALAAANDKYPEDAFKEKDAKEAIKLLYGRTAEPSDKSKLDSPEIAVI